jgi:protein-S-isoprenylcysteine O-methyltransferase Ste14
MSLRYFLPLYLFFYLGAAFFWRSFIVWKRTGINPVVFKKTDSAHDYIGRVFGILFALIVIIVLVHSFWPNGYLLFMPIEWLERTWITTAGLMSLVLSLVWTLLAQTQMGESWRIGIDQEHQTALVRTGVFAFSRNPIFLGMIITLLGLFLVIPNALTLLTLMIGVMLIGTQVRLEEEFLLKSHGEDYARYKRHVRRWF